MIGRVTEGGRGYFWLVNDTDSVFMHMQDARRSRYREVSVGEVFKFDVEVLRDGSKRAVNLRRID